MTEKNLQLITEGSSIWNVSAITIADDVVAFNGTERPYWKNVLEMATPIITTFNLFLLMTGMGCATYLREIWSNLKKPWGSVIGMICQFGILPAGGFGLALLFNLPDYQALGLLILCCSPGGAFSNFFAYWLDGDIALSLLMTATSSLLAFGGMPLNMWIYSHTWINEQIKIPYVNILISMAFATGPALLGMLIRHWSRIWANRITKICSVLGWIGAIVGGLFIVFIYWEALMTATWKLCMASAIVPFLGFFCAFAISKVFCLNNCVCRTIGIETGCQNMVVALNVIMLSFPDPQIRSKMIILPMVYGLSQLVEVVTFIVAFHSYKFCHRHDVTEETVKSVIDDTVLMRVPTPLEAQRRQEEEVVLVDPDVIKKNGVWTYADEDKNTNGNTLEECRDIPLLLTAIKPYITPGEDSEDLQKSPQNTTENYYKENDNFLSSTEAVSNSSHSVKIENPNSAFSGPGRSSGRRINGVNQLDEPNVVGAQLCSNCRYPINEVVEGRGVTGTKHFRENGSFRNPPPRSPSMNSGYGFPTFRNRNDQ